MTLSPALPTLEFYTRDGCGLCEEGRLALQQVLEQRVMRGDPIPRIHEVNLSEHPEFESRYGALLPVMAIDTHELTLAMGGPTIERFLDRILGRLG